MPDLQSELGKITRTIGAWQPPAPSKPFAGDTLAELKRLAAERPTAVMVTVKIEALHREPGDLLVLETQSLATEKMVEDVQDAIDAHRRG